MKATVLLTVATIFNSLHGHPLLEEGSICTNPDSTPGLCTKYSQCPQAREQVKNSERHNFTRCSFSIKEEIVCCPASTSIRIPNVGNVSSRSKEFCEQYTKSFKPSVVPQIADGKDAEPGRFPFMGALGLYVADSKVYQFKCGGTLISDRHVLTAAHCLDNIEGDEVKVVRLGVVKVPEMVEKVDPVVDYGVKRYVAHPKFKRRFNSTYRYFNDIAVLELERRVEFSDNLRPACLFNNGSGYPEEFLITGWGDNEVSVRKETLQMAKVSSYPQQDCYNKYWDVYNITLTDNQLCAIHSTKDTCQGDSGGPLIMPNSTFIVGITSFGPPACGAGSPSVYTNVVKYLQWIEKTVWGE